MFEFRAIHYENKRVKSVTRARVVDEKAKLDMFINVYLSLKYLVTLFFLFVYSMLWREIQTSEIICAPSFMQGIGIAIPF